jgi:hypothetical protein
MDFSLKAFLDIGLAFFGASGSSVIGFFATPLLAGDFFAFEVFADARAALTGFFAGLAARFVAIVGRLNSRHCGHAPSPTLLVVPAKAGDPVFPEFSLGASTSPAL